MYSKKWKTIFILIPFIFFFVAVLIPTIVGFYTSFTNWKGINSPFSADTVGFKNYELAFNMNDNSFGKSIWFTIKLAIVLVLLVNLLGLSMAYIVTRKTRGTNFFKGAYFIPNLIGGIVVGFIWNFIFRQIFKSLNFGDQWLNDSNTGFWAIVIVIVWQQAGYIMVIYVAAIQNIPIDVEEATKIDGAKPIKKSLKIFLPYIMTAFTITTFLIIRISFGLFDQVLVLTGGGPNYSTQTMAIDIYNTLFTYKLGAYFQVGQAKGVLYFLIVVAIGLTQVAVTKRREARG